MFAPFAIVMFESLSRPRCTKDKKYFQIIRKRNENAKDAGKLKNLQDLEDSSEEHWAF